MDMDSYNHTVAGIFAVKNVMMSDIVIGVTGVVVSISEGISEQLLISGMSFEYGRRGRNRGFIIPASARWPGWVRRVHGEYPKISYT